MADECIRVHLVLSNVDVTSAPADCVPVSSLALTCPTAPATPVTPDCSGAWTVSVVINPASVTCSEIALQADPSDPTVDQATFLLTWTEALTFTDAATGSTCGASRTVSAPVLADLVHPTSMSVIPGAPVSYYCNLIGTPTCHAVLNFVGGECSVCTVRALALNIEEVGVANRVITTLGACPVSSTPLP